MSNLTENIKDQVGRLEDLIKLYVDQEKERQKQHMDFSLEKLSAIKKAQQQVLGGFVVSITILLGLTQLPILKSDSSSSILIVYDLITTIVILLGMAGAVFFLFTFWHNRTAQTLGALNRNYDTAIQNLQQILAYSIIGTLNKFEGQISAVLEVAKAVMILKDANALYQIKSHEKISKLWIVTTIPVREQYHKERVEYLKSSATAMYEEYVKLDRTNMSPEMRNVICNVFYDNEEYIKIKY